MVERWLLFSSHSEQKTPPELQLTSEKSLVGAVTMNPLAWTADEAQAHMSRRLVFAMLALGYFTYLFIRRRIQSQADQAFAAQHGCLPMQTKFPSKWPFALDILKKQYDALPSKRLLAFQSQYFDKIGPNMELKLFGAAGYMTTDPKNIESLLSTNFEDWGLGSRVGGLFPLLGQGIFTQDGRAWKHSREILRRQFARIQYQNLKVFDEHIEELVSGLSAAAGEGKDTIVDMQPFFFRFTLSTTTDLIFGEPLGTLGEDVREKFSSNFDYASLISAIRLRLADFHWLHRSSKYSEACNVVKKYADHFVSQALACRDREGEEAASERYPFILDLYKDLNDTALVRDQLVNVLIAGRDTTACLMSWTFFMLVRHPESLQRLRDEIAAALPDGQPLTRALLPKIPYLRYVLNETLRLYPQIPVNVRVAVKTTFLPSGGGPDGTSPVLMPKGTGVGYSVYHMHRRMSLYGENANEFCPERWESTDLERKVGWGFLAFHGGPRLCLGKDFALSEASYGIIKIIQTFPGLRLPPSIEKLPTGQETQNLTLVVSSAEGCKVVLR
ncbi:cytochrome P450 [Corynespora cassiicola Philippines]|uniref:Cytochrome P450 n=1 Tax=Corynespora cassiicola Philippines TaxID=1448308 RepID=A0A2T2NLR3_CORCC|nr:cytochrome P450 [Corynespora cassiicola Philippines]